MPCGTRRCGGCGPAIYRPRLLARLFKGIAARPGALFITLTAPSFCDADCVRGGRAAPAPRARPPVEASRLTRGSTPLRKSTHDAPDDGPGAEWGGGHSRGCRARAGVWNEGGPARWNHFWTVLRRGFPRAQMLKVWEVQKRGALHAHVLVTGVPWLPKRELGVLAVRAGWGFIVDVQRADSGTVGYLAKYILKDLDGSGLTRVWSCSRDWAPEWVVRSRSSQGDTGWVWRGFGPELVIERRAASSQPLPVGVDGG